MFVPGWSIPLVLIRLFGSATSSPLVTRTPAPPLPSQISPPSLLPTNSPSLLSPSLSTPSLEPSFIISPGELTEKAECHLKISPSTVVVRFGGPVKANCSKERVGFPMLGWKVSTEDIPLTMNDHLIWSVDNLTEWGIKPTCYAVSDVGGQCNIDLSLIVYQPPQKVSIRFVNHTGPMFEGHQYNLQCTVQDVAPIEKAIVTFYRGQTILAQLQSNTTTEKTPVNKSFNLSIIPCKQHNRTQYWCEVKLELGPEGPRHPPVVKSQNLTALVLSSPQVTRPTEQQAKTNLKCVVERNPEPLGGRGTANSWKGYLLLAALLAQMINQL